MKNPKYYNGSRIRNAWTNLNFIDKKINVTTIMDIIEDSKNGKELVKRLNSLNMVQNEWAIDRETDTMVRIRYTDPLHNVDYIECEKEQIEIGKLSNKLHFETALEILKKPIFDDDATYMGAVLFVSEAFDVSVDKLLESVEPNC